MQYPETHQCLKCKRLPDIERCKSELCKYVYVISCFCDRLNPVISTKEEDALKLWNTKNPTNQQ